jgi:hypothetical protein
MMRSGFMKSAIAAPSFRNSQVRGPVFIGRRSHGDDLKKAVFDALRGVGREFEPAGFGVASDERIEARLMDRHHALRQALDLGLIDIDAQDVVAGIRQARPRDEADVAGAEDGHAHCCYLPPRPRAGEVWGEGFMLLMP